MINDDDATENVIAFEPRRPSTPLLTHIEVRLGANYAIEVRLFTDAGDLAAILEYGLVAQSPTDYDLTMFKVAWDVWRNTSTRAS